MSRGRGCPRVAVGVEIEGGFARYGRLLPRAMRYEIVARWVAGIVMGGHAAPGVSWGRDSAADELSVVVSWSVVSRNM